jgi:hypothetical protein
VFEHVDEDSDMREERQESIAYLCLREGKRERGEKERKMESV